jgi:abortive phage resistance protein AbiGi (putative antitoxin)
VAKAPVGSVPPRRKSRDTEGLPLHVNPGTVSKILWHFTGGPLWDTTQNKQLTTRKPARQAYANLVSILRAKELRLGTYKEIVRVMVAERRRYDPKSDKFEIVKNVPVELKSAAVCCISDIPANHLGYHAFRYGKFALGFHRSAVVRHGFNPVFYTLEDTGVVRSIHQGFSRLQFADVEDVKSASGSAEDAVNDLPDGVDGDDIRSYLSDVESAADTVQGHIESAKDGVENFLAFVKTFTRNEFDTIYCEREWRSVSTYAFSTDDIAMIVVPRRIGKKYYFENFVRKVAPRLKLPPTIPVVPWEDLIEH